MLYRMTNGNALSEYGLLLGTVILLSLGGLTMLGQSIVTLLTNPNPGAGGNGMLSNFYFSNVSSLGAWAASTGESATGSSGTLSSGNNQSADSTITADTNAVEDNTGVAVNVTSVEGNQHNVLGVLRLADYLGALADQEVVPEKKDYYSKIAKLAYYLGANEGELDDFSNYSGGGKYTNADALNDIISKQQTLKALLRNPPEGLNAEDMAKVMPEAREVVAIAQDYKEHLRSVLGSDGKAHYEFSIRNFSNTGFTVGQGSTLGNNYQITRADAAEFPLHNVPYDSIVSYDQLKSMVKATLSQNPISADPPVITTFNGGTTADNTENQ